MNGCGPGNSSVYPLPIRRLCRATACYLLLVTCYSALLHRRRLTEAVAQIVEDVPAVVLTDARLEGGHDPAQSVGDHAEEKLDRVIRHVVVEVGRRDAEGRCRRAVTATGFAMTHSAVLREQHPPARYRFR